MITAVSVETKQQGITIIAEARMLTIDGRDGIIRVGLRFGFAEST